MTGRALLERVFSNWVVKVLSVAAAVVLFLFQRIGSLEERFLGVPLPLFIYARTLCPLALGWDAWVFHDESELTTGLSCRGRPELFVCHPQ